MPELARFAQENVNFTQHMSSGNTTDSGMFGLFYGISPGYMDGVLSARIPAALITAFNQQGYQLGLFSSDGLAARSIARRCCPISRCPMRKRRAMSKRRTSGLAGSIAMRRMKTAGSRGFR
jgi:membrane-anchored protein YejM (alkaline phosphatase superfamily)